MAIEYNEWIRRDLKNKVVKINGTDNCKVVTFSCNFLLDVLQIDAQVVIEKLISAFKQTSIVTRLLPPILDSKRRKYRMHQRRSPRWQSAEEPGGPSPREPLLAHDFVS